MGQGFDTSETFTISLKTLPPQNSQITPTENNKGVQVNMKMDTQIFPYVGVGPLISEELLEEEIGTLQYQLVSCFGHDLCL